MNNQTPGKYPGKFIVFEGVDGSGKSTQIRLLADWLESENIEVVKTFEPGHIREFQVRDILLNSEKSLDPIAELFLFLADRAQHVTSVIIPALEQGKYVLCDRYIYSTIAYQGSKGFINATRINYLNEIVTSGLKPDLVLWFDIDAQSALSRKNQLDKFEKINFLEKVRKSYNDQYSAELWNTNTIFSRIHAFDAINQIHNNIKAIIKNRIFNQI